MCKGGREGGQGKEGDQRGRMKEGGREIGGGGGGERGRGEREGGGRPEERERARPTGAVENASSKIIFEASMNAEINNR